jgi:hypothetical protein
VHAERDEERTASGMDAHAEGAMACDAPPKRGGRRSGASRKPAHGLTRLRRSVTVLTTRRLDGRTVMAREVRRWKDDVRRELGGDLTRAQETILEAAAQSWVILASLDDYIARQSSLVTKKRRVIDVVTQRMQIAEGLAKHLERLGLERRSRNT